VKSLSAQIKVAGAVLGMVVFLVSNGMCQAKSQPTPTSSPGGAQTAPQPQGEDIPPCNGIPSSPSAGQGPSKVNPHPHSVTLSWGAPAPATNSPRDAIKGYYVYRSQKPHMYDESNRISDSPLRGTRCVDSNVEPRKTYFYVVKAVTEGGKQSGSSIEIKAVVPSP
jgi:hypothetical protein